MALSSERLREYARMGAALRLTQLSEEIAIIHAAFPELRSQKRTAALLKMSVPPAHGLATVQDGPPTTRKRRRRRKLTAAEKKFISERMKKYWAARKKKA